MGRGKGCWHELGNTMASDRQQSNSNSTIDWNDSMTWLTKKWLSTNWLKTALRFKTRSLIAPLLNKAHDVSKRLFWHW